MRNSVRPVVVASLTLALLAGFGTESAFANQGAGLGTSTGGDVNTRGETVPLTVQRAAARKQAAAASYVHAKRLRVRSASGATTEQAATKVLAVRHYGQIKSFYCGPASGKMILKYLDAGPSRYNHRLQTQRRIGGPAHMATDVNGKTSWASGLFRVGLNRWREGKSDGFYVDKHDPSVSYFTNALTLDVDRGYPFGADTVEVAGGVHYNGHPTNQTIGHWIVAHGYFGGGTSTRFADPSTTVWSTPSDHFTYTTSDFVNRFLNQNGITW